MVVIVERALASKAQDTASAKHLFVSTSEVEPLFSTQDAERIDRPMLDWLALTTQWHRADPWQALLSLAVHGHLFECN